jgi:hypothetical protein
MADGRPTLEDIEQRIQALLGQEREGATETVSDLLTRGHKLAAYQTAAPTDELQAMINQQLDEVANELLDILLGWTSLGGQVELGVAGAPLNTITPKVVSALPPTVSLPTSPPPTEAPEATLGADLELVEESLDLGHPLEGEDTIEREMASVDQLQRLQRHVSEGGTLDLPQVANDDWEELLAELLRVGGHKTTPEAELDAIQKIVDHRERWTGLPRRIQCLVIEWLTARLRALQVRGVRDWRVDQGFTVLTHYLRTEQPGFSYGLARSHGPRNDSWEDDAAGHHEELRRLLPDMRLEPANKDKLLAKVSELATEMADAPPFAEAAVASQLVRAIGKALDEGVNPRDTKLVNLATPWTELLDDGRFKSLRRAIREEQSSGEASLERTYDAIPEDWAWWGRTEGRRAVILGGSPRETNRARLQEEFHFAELVWDPAEHKRNVLQRLRDRIRSGGVDLVIVLRRFVGHDTDDVVVRACKESGTDWVHVEHGYGVNQVQAAVERFLDPQPSERESAK